jgi:hypothetical protein
MNLRAEKKFLYEKFLIFDRPVAVIVGLVYRLKCVSRPISNLEKESGVFSFEIKKNPVTPVLVSFNKFGKLRPVS